MAVFVIYHFKIVEVHEKNAEAAGISLRPLKSRCYDFVEAVPAIETGEAVADRLPVYLVEHACIRLADAFLDHEDREKPVGKKIGKMSAQIPKFCQHELSAQCFIQPAAKCAAVQNGDLLRCMLQIQEPKYDDILHQSYFVQTGG